MNAITTETRTLTAEARWNKALKEIRKDGIKIRENLKGLTVACVALGKAFGSEDPSFPYAFSYAEHGDAYKWVGNGETMGYQNGESGKIASVTFYHENESASIIAAAFRANGFLVRWDGNDMMAVVVYPNSKDSE